MRKVLLTMICLTLIWITSCSEFLDVKPIESITGNNFWRTSDDIESFTSGIYDRFRQVTMINSPMFLIAELRSAPVTVNSEHDGLTFVSLLRTNNLGELLASYPEPESTYGFWQMTSWEGLYEVIGLANILDEQLDKLDEGVLTESETNAYRSEAIFLRNLSYFFLVRIFGDVPYYTQAFNERSLPRTDMINVLEHGLAELEFAKEKLPWTYENASLVATKAMKGSVIALMMHMNLWAAGFNQADGEQYYENVVQLGEEIVNNQGAYELLPLDQTDELFSGGSKESLFEIVQNVNNNEQFKLTSIYSNYVLERPNTNYSYPILKYDLDFIRKVYPVDIQDNRREVWFDENLYTDDGHRQVLKFLNFYQNPDGNVNSNVGNQIVFRYADALLMLAEALAELGRDQEALSYANQIRARAGASNLVGSGTFLKNQIYLERVRELLGEGHYFYDLVRTQRIVDGNFTSAPINFSSYLAGAWTWPINSAAIQNNPLITLNNYWN